MKTFLHVLSSAVLVGLLGFPASSARGELVSAWYFEGSDFLTDSVGSADLTQVGAGSVTQSGGSAVFNGTAAFQTGVVDLIPGSGSQFGVEMIFTLDSLPSARAALLTEVVGFGSSTRGFDLYLDSAGAVVTEFGNTGGTTSSFVSANGPFAADPFTLEAGKQYRVGVSYDLSPVNAVFSNFETYTSTYLVDNLTDGTSFSTDVTVTARNISSDPTAFFAIGGRYDNAGTSLVNGADISIEAVGVHDSLISELTLTSAVTAVPEPSSMAMAGIGLGGVLLRRRRRNRAAGPKTA